MATSLTMKHPCEADWPDAIRTKWVPGDLSAIKSSSHGAKGSWRVVRLTKRGGLCPQGGELMPATLAGIFSNQWDQPRNQQYANHVPSSYRSDHGH